MATVDSADYKVSDNQNEKNKKKQGIKVLLYDT